jgi:hypothetical protein
VISAASTRDSCGSTAASSGSPQVRSAQSEGPHLSLGNPAVTGRCAVGGAHQSHQDAP